MLKSVVAALVFMVSVGVHAADTYKVDTAASKVHWKGTKKLGSFHEGGISLQSGEVTLDKGQLTGGSFVIDMKTITNTDVKDAEKNKQLVGHLSNEDFFNVTKYPTTSFKVTSVTPSKTKGEVIVKGDLTMIGQTKPVEFPAKVAVSGNTVTGDAVVKVNRTHFGLKYGSGSIFKELTGDKIINDEFEMTLKLVAKK